MIHAGGKKSNFTPVHLILILNHNLHYCDKDLIYLRFDFKWSVLLSQMLYNSGLSDECRNVITGTKEVKMRTPAIGKYEFPFCWTISALTTWQSTSSRLGNQTCFLLFIIHSLHYPSLYYPSSQRKKQLRKQLSYWSTGRWAYHSCAIGLAHFFPCSKFRFQK